MQAFWGVYSIYVARGFWRFTIPTLVLNNLARKCLRKEWLFAMVGPIEQRVLVIIERYAYENRQMSKGQTFTQEKPIRVCNCATRCTMLKEPCATLVGWSCLQCFKKKKKSRSRIVALGSA